MWDSQDGGVIVVGRLRRLCPWMRALVGDGGCTRRIIDAIRVTASRVVEIVERPKFAKGFVLLPKRWRVKRSIDVPTTIHRLKVDHETLAYVSAVAAHSPSSGRSLASVIMQ